MQRFAFLSCLPAVLAAVASFAADPVDDYSSGIIPEVDAAQLVVSANQDTVQDVAPTSDVSDICCCADGATQFYFRADLLMLDRDNDSRGQTVVEDSFTFAPLANTNDLRFGVEAGHRFTAGAQRCDGLGVMGSYFAVENWDDRNVVLGNNSLALPGDIALATFDFLSADRMQLDYAAELHSAEINVTSNNPCCPCITWFTGFRYLSLDEAFNINSFDVDFGTSDYNIQTSNDLYGGQIGFLLNRDDCCTGWEVSTKLGVYHNHARQDTLLGDLDNTLVLRNVGRSRSETAFVSEIGISAYWQATCRLRVRAGYNLLWIEGIALAPDQLDFTDTPNSSNFVDTDGGALFHGANVGVEAAW